VTGTFEGEQHTVVKTFRAIGGQGEADEYGVFLMYHAPYTPHDYGASAHAGQPAGVTYEWGIGEGADKVEIIGADDQAHVVLRPVHSSADNNDIGLTVAYTLADTTFGYPGGQATVHKPAVPYSHREVGTFASTAGPPVWIQDRYVDYHCRSQLNRAVEGMVWFEDCGNYPDSPYQGPIEQDNDPNNPAVIPADGVIHDRLRFPKPTAWSGQPDLLHHVWQHLFVGGWHGQDALTNPFWSNAITVLDTPTIIVTTQDGHE
jgi:hypothetical protein